MALVRSGSGASVLIVLGDHWRILQPSAAGYWNRRWPLDRCGDPPWIFGWLLRVAALGRNVSMLPQRGLELTVWIALSITAAFARRQSFEVTRNSSSWLLLRALPSVFSFLLRHSAGLRVSGIPDDDSDRSVRNQVRDSGLSVPKHSSWNDRPCMAGFIEWGARHPNEALEFEW